MLKLRRVGLFAALGLAFALLVAALPFNVLGLGVTTVSAQYASYTGGTSAERICGGSVSAQFRFYGATTWYFDSGLTTPGGTLTNSPGPQKFLVCDSSLGSAKAVLIVYANGSLLWVPRSAGGLVGRSAADNQ